MNSYTSTQDEFELIAKILLDFFAEHDVTSEITIGDFFCLVDEIQNGIRKLKQEVKK